MNEVLGPLGVIEGMGRDIFQDPHPLKNKARPVCKESGAQHSARIPWNSCGGRPDDKDSIYSVEVARSSWLVFRSW